MEREGEEHSQVGNGSANRVLGRDRQRAILQNGQRHSSTGSLLFLDEYFRQVSRFFDNWPTQWSFFALVVGYSRAESFPRFVDITFVDITIVCYGFMWELGGGCRTADHQERLR